MRNFRITFLIVGCLFVFGIYALARIPKQEFPEYTIRQGVVVGVYPGATAEEVEEQLAKPLEQFLMTYKEVKRAKTTSTSQNGMCYVMVELNDDVNDKDEVWSKVKHGLAAFKMQLPAGGLGDVYKRQACGCRGRGDQRRFRRHLGAADHPRIGHALLP